MNGAARPCITRRQGPTRPDWTPFSPLAPNRTHENAEGKTPWDQIIADSSVDLADIAVSEDRRFVRRLKEASAKCRAMDYGGFVAWLRSECPHL